MYFISNVRSPPPLFPFKHMCTEVPRVQGELQEGETGIVVAIIIVRGEKQPRTLTKYLQPFSHESNKYNGNLLRTKFITDR